MNTDDLISLLATGVEPVDARAQARAVLVAVSAGLLLAAALMAGLLGVEPTLAAEARLPAFWARELFCLAVATSGLVCLRRLAHPGMRTGWTGPASALPAALLWLLAAAVLMQTAPEQRMATVLGHTARVCSLLIALVSTPVFVALVWVLRRFAPTRLRLAGAVAGWAAGGAGALVYTLHCPELAPPFIAVWYVLGMLIPAAAGAWLGPRLLRW